ncbi:peptidoglycan bridge formation glycyltransferase FemA/FemB family protein [Candidatus Saccharibacteria bacterium]|nr:peptidoglycan bridge formation glycyltransferase FemA/FemB family protein [Candidatus Saccharibacteria bacterium]
MKKTFREITPDEFAKFTNHCSAKNYMQSVPMYRRYQTISREAYLLGAFEGDTLVVAGLASKIYERFGRKVFTFSRGPLADYVDHEATFFYFLDQAKIFLKSHAGMVLQISPSLISPDAPSDFASKLKGHGFKNLGEYEQVKWTYAINFARHDSLPPKNIATKRSAVLNPPLSAEETQALISSFRRDHRYTIRYATERYGLKLRELPVSEYQVLLDLIKESGKVHGFVPRDLDFFRQIKEAFGDDAVAVVAENPDGVPVAAAFFLLYGDEVIYLSSGFRRDYKKLGGPHLIQWAMIRFAYANGYRQYNFWGTNPDPDNGVHKFKQGFHGELEDFIGTFAAPLTLTGQLYVAKLKYQEQRDL